MLRKKLAILLIATLALFLGACNRNKIKNPIAGLDSKQPDKVLYDRAVEALNKNKYDVARITLQTLINTYPDSEYIARAKLTVADSWYKEGGSAALAQAEQEYKDFITFFPNMPEAAEAQMKVAGIHYRQMEKPDRDYTHAKRAEDEYREMVRMFPDSSLLPEAKKRLMEVQEVLAEREFRVGRFYFLRESWPAAIARLKSLSDTYQLYSGADEVLFMLGSAYEREMDMVRNSRFSEIQKSNLLSDMKRKAGDAYGRILTRYPAMDRAEEATKRLTDLGLPVPTASQEMLSQNQAEEQSRSEMGRIGKMMRMMRSRPDVSRAVKVGEPVLQDPPPTHATDVVRNMTAVADAGPGASTVSAETVKGDPLKNEAVPRSDDGPASNPPPTPVNDAITSGSQTDKGATADKVDKKSESTSKKKKKKGLAKLNPF
ncbi:MAG: outer membrane protein assembly factor BamD [Acidobacteriales bacterium]|nr:outer membrane protein assembly factor BamD [Terriglobales bacterium]